MRILTFVLIGFEYNMKFLAVCLISISIGAITLRNIPALIVPEGLETSLLGMTYLGQLQKVEATPNALLLRL